MKKIYLHLGMHKTGTSFVQSTLRKNEAMLRDTGTRVVLGRESNEFLQSIDHDMIRDNWMNAECDVVVFSNENFVLLEYPERVDLARELRDTAIDAGADVVMIFYVRPAIEWIPSMWAQYVKVAAPDFGNMTLDEFIETFDYLTVLDVIASLRFEGNTMIRPYVRALMKNESIFDDFFDAIGLIPGDIDVELPSLQRNTTPSRRQIDLARTYNQNQLPGLPARRHHLRMLNSFLRARHYRDPTPSVAATVTRAQLQAISDRYAGAEAALTDGAVDSRSRLTEHLATAPDSYVPDVPAEAVDYYLQNMWILSTIDDLKGVDDSAVPDALRRAE